MAKKKIMQRNEKRWKCEYCGALNDLELNKCSSCSGIRTSNSEIVDVLTDYEEETREEFGNEIDEAYNKANDSSKRKIAISIFVFFVLVGVLTFVITTSHNTTTVVSKEWEYDLTISKWKAEKDIVSFNLPPADAENIRTEQVKTSDDSRWYRTQYTYDLSSWKTDRVEKIKGSGILPTFEEYQVNEDEKVTKTSEVQYYVILRVSKDETRKVKITKDMWIDLEIGDVVEYTDGKINK